MKNPTKLTIKQRLFVNELLRNGGDQTAAALKAGVPEKSAEPFCNFGISPAAVCPGMGKLR